MSNRAKMSGNSAHGQTNRKTPQESLEEFAKLFDHDLHNAPAPFSPNMTADRVAQFQRSFGKEIYADPTGRNLFRNSFHYHHMGLQQPAMRVCTEILQLDAKNRLALFLRGLLYHKLQQPTNAINDYNRVLALDPSNVFALLARGASYFVMQHYEEAMEDYTKASESDPAYALYCRGRCYDAYEQPEWAIKDYLQATTYDSSFLDAHFACAEDYFGLGRYQRAMVCFEKVLNLDPENPVAFFQLGFGHGVKGNSAQAKWHFDEAARLGIEKAQPVAQQLRQNGTMWSVPSSEAFDRFFGTSTAYGVRQLVSRFPFMTDPGFIQILLTHIELKVPPRFYSAQFERLNWLYQVVLGPK